MIGFRCLGCSLKDLPIEASRCPRCDKEHFVAECMPLSHPVSQRPPTALSTNFSQKSAKAKRQVIGSSPAVEEQNETTRKDLTFFSEDSRLGIKRTDVENHGIKDDIGISSSSSNICWNEKQPSQDFSQDDIQKKRFLPENRNGCGDMHPLHASDDYSLNSSSVNFLSDLMRAPFAEPQALINFPHELSSTECENPSCIWMPIQKYERTETLPIENEDGKMDFASSFHSKPQKLMQQSYLESVTIENKLQVTRDKCCNSTEDLLTKTWDFSTLNFHSKDFKIVNEYPEHEDLYSKQQTRIAVRENTLKTLSVPTSKKSKKGFRCGKCSKRFMSESALDVHVKSNCVPNPYKCDQCPKKYNRKSQLILHQQVHSTERLFKCDLCDYAAKWEKNLKRHAEKWHGK